MNFKRLAPQTPVNTLFKWTENNYDIAINYYQQREEAFVRTFSNYLTSSLDARKEELSNSIQNAIINAWGKSVKGGSPTLTYAAFAGGTNGTGLKDLATGTYDCSPQAINQLIKSDPYISGDTRAQQLLYALGKKANNKSGMTFSEIAGYIGNVYEDTVYSNVMQPYISNTQSGLQNVVLNTIQQIGNQKSTGSKFKDRTDELVGTDIIMSVGQISGRQSGTHKNGKSTQILVDSKGFPVELQGEISWNNIEDVYYRQILDQYITICQSFGFQIKLGSDLTSIRKAYTHSAAIQSYINNSTNKRTWQPTYAAIWSLYQISKFLITIIGPMNVILVHGNNVDYFSDILNKYLFYMNVHFDQLIEHHRQITQEPSTEVQNASNIYTGTRVEGKQNKNSKNSFINESGIYLRGRPKNLYSLTTFSKSEERIKNKDGTISSNGFTIRTKIKNVNYSKNKLT